MSVHGHLETRSDTSSKVELAAAFNHSEEEGQVTITRQKGEQFFRACNGYNMEENIYW